MKIIREKEGKANTGSRLKRPACLFFLLAFLIVCYFACRYYREDRKREKRFEQLEKVEKEQDENPVSPICPTELDNPDWIGWLKIEGIHFSYPVMQRKGDDGYYLHRDFDGNYSFYGTPFLDSRCTLDSDNCIIYGHNINGGRMFGKLHAYANENYYRKHPEIKLRAGEERREYGIVSVIQTATSSSVYSFTEVGNWEEYREYVYKILSDSLYHTEMGDRMERERNGETAEAFFRKYQFLTLSTCRSWVGRDARLLVVAARERKFTD
ncbi:MAG: class B sortase [Ruminococcus flavefaciens]|nr:class B sortase [Ruminococcus flavefaciens]